MEQRLFVKKTNAKASYDNLRSSYCLDLTEIIIYSFYLRSIARYYLVHSYFKFQATKNLNENKSFVSQPFRRRAIYSGGVERVNFLVPYSLVISSTQ